MGRLLIIPLFGGSISRPLGGFLSQALMGPVIVVTLKKLPDESAGMLFIENDHVVETHMEMHNATAIQRQYDEHIRSGV
jgi:hypothetical protein